MVKNVIIVHGWGGKPEHGWHLWLKDELEKKGYVVFVPEMPNTDEPKIDLWSNKLKEIAGSVDEETLLIGHSIGCQTIMRYLEQLGEGEKVGKVIFIAPWMHLDEKTIEEEEPGSIEIIKDWLEIPINFDKVKTHCSKFICLFSDNDPYVPLSDVDLFKDNLNAKTKVFSNKGHFTEDDGCKELPEILEFL